MTDIQEEKYRKLLAFWIGEDSDAAHPVEERYLMLVGIRADLRTPAEKDELVTLVNVMSEAVDEMEKVYKARLDKHLGRTT